MSNQINIAVGADISGLKKGMTDAASTMQSAGEQMAAVGAKVESTTTTSFKNLQQAYRATAKDAQVLAMTLGTDSAAFQQAAQKAAMFKDQLDDVNDVISAYHPEKKWQLTGQAIAATVDIAQGFVGVLSLIGVESNNAQKYIQAMMSLQSISGAILAVEQLSGAYKALTISIFGAEAATNSLYLAMIKPLRIIGALLGAGAVLLGLTNEAGATSAVYNRTAKEVGDLIQSSINKEKNLTEQVKITNKLRIDAMEEGADKSKAIAKNNYDNQISDLKEYLATKLIDEKTYQERSKLYFEIYQHELNKIDKENKNKRAKPITIAQPLEIESKLTSMGGLQDLGSKSMAENTQKALNEGWAKINAENIKGMAKWQENWKGFNNVVKEESELTKLLFDSAAQALAGAAANLGAALVTGDFESAGKAIIQMLGGIAIQIGAAMIAMGVPMALGEPFFGGKSLRLIAGGAALSVAGGAMQASGRASGGGGGGGGGFTSGGGGQSFNPVFAGGSQYLMLDSRVRGTDIIISADNQRRQNGRIR